MIITQYIILKLQLLDLTLSIRPIHEIPNCICITVRNDKYAYSSMIYKDLYELYEDNDMLLDVIIDKFKTESENI